MSRVVRCSLFNDSIRVERRSTTTLKGRTQMTSTLFENVRAVVSVASPTDLDRLGDIQVMGLHLSIVTEFKLHSAVRGFQPDLIEWRDNTFLVKSVEPYPQYGPGFYQVIVGSSESTLTPPDEIITPPQAINNWLAFDVNFDTIGN